MDISINRNSIANMAPQVPVDQTAAAKAGAQPAGTAGVSVTKTAAAPEDAAAAAISESSLTRDDPLGRLVSAAFNLPAPPMPLFE